MLHFAGAGRKSAVPRASHTLPDARAGCPAAGGAGGGRKGRQQPQERALAAVSMRELLEAGVHFGHQTRRWNPKMKRYIYGARNGIYIMDLHQTIEPVRRGGRTSSRSGGERRARALRRHQEAGAGPRSGSPRSAAGSSTSTSGGWAACSPISPPSRPASSACAELERMEADGTFERLPKKEAAAAPASSATSWTGSSAASRTWTGSPDALFIVDLKKERIAVAEARKLRIPVVAIVDTNCDPDDVDYVIPGNDDAIRSIRLMAQRVADAIVEVRGRAVVAGRGSGGSDGSGDRWSTSPRRRTPRSRRSGWRGRAAAPRGWTTDRSFGCGRRKRTGASVRE